MGQPLFKADQAKLKRKDIKPGSRSFCEASQKCSLGARVQRRDKFTLTRKIVRASPLQPEEQKLVHLLCL